MQQARGRYEVHTRFQSENLYERYRLQEMDFYGRVLLKCVVNKV